MPNTPPTRRELVMQDRESLVKASAVLMAMAINFSHDLDVNAESRIQVVTDCTSAAQTIAYLLQYAGMDNAEILATAASVDREREMLLALESEPEGGE